MARHGSGLQTHPGSCPRGQCLSRGRRGAAWRRVEAGEGRGGEGEEEDALNEDPGKGRRRARHAMRPQPGGPGSCVLEKTRGVTIVLKLVVSSESEHIEFTRKHFLGVKSSQPHCFGNNFTYPSDTPSLLNKTLQSKSITGEACVAGTEDTKGARRVPPASDHTAGYRGPSRRPSSPQGHLRRSWSRP